MSASHANAMEDSIQETVSKEEVSANARSNFYLLTVTLVTKAITIILIVNLVTVTKMVPLVGYAKWEAANALAKLIILIKIVTSALPAISILLNVTLATALTRVLWIMLATHLPANADVRITTAV